MVFAASTRQMGDVTIVDVRGRFTLSEGEALHELLPDLFRQGRKRVLLNFRGGSYLDSSGVGQLGPRFTRREKATPISGRWN